MAHALTVGHGIALAALWLGVGCVVLGGVGMLLLSNLYDRLHGLAVASVVGASLIGIALVIAAGPGRELAKLIVIVTLLVAGGPVVTMATARAAAQDEGRVARESPR
jgi:monovalent cation/proton antiporter MnhG/PhaG subunit